MKRQLIGLASTAIPQWIGRRIAGRFVPIFMLHRTVDEQGRPLGEHLRVIRKQLEYLRRHNYRPLRLIDLLQRIDKGEPLPRRSVVFTVDDGFFDQAELLGPLFAEFDIPFTCFVITDFLDRKLWSWDDQLLYALGNSHKSRIDLRLPDESLFSFTPGDFFKPQIRALRQALKSADQTHVYDWLDQLYTAAEVDRPADIPEAYRPMSWEQADGLIRAGHDIAPHTRSHRILSRLKDRDAEQEILQSFERVRQRLPDSVPLFAYPTGRAQDFTRRDRDVVARSPMIGAVSTIPIAVTPPVDRYTLPRYGLPLNIADFIQYLDWVEVTKNRLRQLFH